MDKLTQTKAEFKAGCRDYFDDPQYEDPIKQTIFETDLKKCSSISNMICLAKKNLIPPKYWEWIF